MSLAHYSRHSPHAIALWHRAEVVAADTDANATAPRTESHGTCSCQRLGKGKHCTASGKTKGLAHVVAYGHQCLAALGIGSVEEFNAQCPNDVLTGTDNSCYVF